METYNPYKLTVKRIGLTIEQIRALNPPPNPAKVTDTRFLSYMRKYGKDSWELDALEPKFIDSLLRNHITEVIDFDIWDTMIEAEHKDKEKLYALSSKL